MPDSRASLTSALCYRDPRAALAWLEKAFGFEVVHADRGRGRAMWPTPRCGSANALVMVGSEWSADHDSPASIGGKNTQTVHIQVATDIDAHCERARAAGAEIIMEPEDQFYGDRSYRCRDPEGHIWTVGQTVKVVTREEAEAASGLKIEGWV